MLAARLAEHLPPCPIRREDRPAEEAMDPVHHLPVEIVTLIFQQVVLAAGRPILLGWVSRGWRFIAWNSPALWTNIRFGLPSTMEWYLTLRRKEHLEMASQWLERSRSLPLHIEIYWPINSHDERDSEVLVSLEKELVTLVKKFAGRWRILSLSFAEDDRIEIFFDKNEYFAAPMLEKLRIELQPEEEYDFSEAEPHFYLPGCSPSLMDLGDIDLSLVSIDWNKLTCLSFYFCNNFGPDELISLLQAAPNLEICTVRGTSRFLERTPDAFPIRNTLITHSKLHTLTLIVDQESCRQHFGRLLSFVDFPSLRTLKYDYRSAPRNLQMPILRTFIPFTYKSATSLSNLYLKSITAIAPNSTNFLIVLLHAMQNLQTLAISDCFGFISDAFFDQFDGGQFLPSLRIFNYIGSQSFSWASFKKMLPRMDTPPQGVATLRECHVYLSDGLEMDGALRQTLETLTNAEVKELKAINHKALEALGFEHDDYDDEFWGPYLPEISAKGAPGSEKKTGRKQYRPEVWEGIFSSI